MNLIIFTAVAIAAASAASIVTSEEFENFKTKFGKKYENETEEEFRRDIFMENMEMIKEHNKKFESGEESYSLEINHLSDLLPHEVIMGCDMDESLEEVEGEPEFSSENVEVPSKWDWRAKGAVTPVKNQKDCGSCWAFSTTGALEGQWFLKHGKLESLSEQNLVDCSKKNKGCGGGSSAIAFEYVRNNGGIDSEESYPYKGIEQKCHYDPKKSDVKVKGFQRIKAKESILKVAVATVGPIAVSIDAHRKFLYYRGGVFYDKHCKSNRHNHAVLVVGYGTEKGKDYWLVKNSWGKRWGEQGYIKMARNRKNHCAIASNGLYPVV